MSSLHMILLNKGKIFLLFNILIGRGNDDIIWYHVMNINDIIIF